MTLTIYSDSINNKYLGYNGDSSSVATGQEILDNLVPLVESFSGNTATFNESRFGWRTDGTATTVALADSGNSFYNFATTTAGNGLGLQYDDGSVVDHIVSQIDSGNPDFSTLDKGVAYSNGTDVGAFAWSGLGDISLFLWAGKVKGNSNLNTSMRRCGIILKYNGGVRSNSDSVGVDFDENGQVFRRVHLTSNAAADHTISCGTQGGRLWLLTTSEKSVGYCENIYLYNYNAGEELRPGVFVDLNNTFDGGSEQGVVVGRWGDEGSIIMRVYDGVN